MCELRFTELVYSKVIFLAEERNLVFAICESFSSFLMMTVNKYMIKYEHRKSGCTKREKNAREPGNVRKMACIQQLEVHESNEVIEL